MGKAFNEEHPQKALSAILINVLDEDKQLN